VIRQLLSLARRPDLDLRPVNINDIVRHVWEVIGHQDRADGVTMVLNLADTVPLVSGDPDQLQQVMLNLCVNALQAVGNSGCITLYTRRRHRSHMNAKPVVEIEVTNTGPPIPPDELPHIFEPFFTTKSQEGGTGLGLAICQDIILSHSGEIHVENAANQGVRFIVLLPVLHDLNEPFANRIEAVGEEERNGHGVA
jgi:signal transduction histidine kinase